MENTHSLLPNIYHGKSPTSRVQGLNNRFKDKNTSHKLLDSNKLHPRKTKPKPQQALQAAIEGKPDFKGSLPKMYDSSVDPLTKDLFE